MNPAATALRTRHKHLAAAIRRRPLTASTGALLCLALVQGLWRMGANPYNHLDLGPTWIPSAVHAEPVSMRDFLLPVPAAMGVEWESAQVDKLLKQGRDLAMELPVAYAVVQVGTDEIRFSGQPVVDLVDRAVPTVALKGQLIPKLYDMALLHAEAKKGVGDQVDCDDSSAASCLPWDEFRGQVLLVVDRRVPFSTLRTVMYTMGQAQFSAFAFLTDDPNPNPLPAAPPASGPSKRPLNLLLHVHSAGLTVSGLEDIHSTQGETSADGRLLSCHGESCDDTDDYDWAALSNLLLQAREGSPRSESIILVPDSDTPYETLIRALDTTRQTSSSATTPARPLFPYAIIAGGAACAGTSGRGASGWLTPDSVLSVLKTTLPAIGAPAASNNDWDKEGGISGSRDQVANSGLLLKMIGTRGESASIGDLFADDTDGTLRDLDAALSAVGGLTVGGLLADDHGGGEAAVPAQASLRTWFPETFIFEPLLVTDENGRATYDTTAPDSLTTWRVLGLAYNRQGNQTGALAQFQSALPAWVEFTPPSALRVGDQVALPLLVVNNTDKPLRVPLLASVRGDGAQGALSRNINLPAWGSEVHLLPVNAVQAGQVTLQAVLGDQDRLERTLEILPSGRKVQQEAGATLGQNQQVNLPRPAGASAAGGQLRLTVYPGPLAIMEAELTRVRHGGGDLAAVAYAHALVGRGAQLAAAMGVAQVQQDQRSDRLATYQSLQHHLHHPDGRQALVALHGLSQPQDELALSQARILATLLAGQQSPDGSFALVIGQGSFNEAVVFAAEAGRLCGTLQSRVAQRARGFVNRSAPAVREPYTAAVLLASGLLDEPRAQSMLDVLQQAVSVVDGKTRIIQEDHARRVDGSRPGALETTAVAIRALQAATTLGLEPAPELLDALAHSLLADYRPNTGFGDGLASLAALEALAAIFAEPLPEKVALEILQGDKPLFQRSLDLSAGPAPFMATLPAPAGDEPLTVRATPPLPGLLFTLTRTDRIPWEKSADEDPAGFGLRLALDGDPVAGARTPVHLWLAAPAGQRCTVTLELPAGVEPDGASLAALRKQRLIEKYRTEGNKVVLTISAGASNNNLSFDVFPTLAGTLQGGASVLALVADPQQRVESGLGIWNVTAP